MNGIRNEYIVTMGGKRPAAVHIMAEDEMDACWQARGIAARHGRPLVDVIHADY